MSKTTFEKLGIPYEERDESSIRFLSQGQRRQI